MLKLVIDGDERWDSVIEKFVYPDRITVELEHSLVSLSKWESKFEKPFLTEESKTTEELLTYVECMILNVENTEDIVPLLRQNHVNDITKYIDSKQTATWFSDTKSGTSSQVITSELIYYWMFAAGLDISCQDWHLNRLFTLLRVHSAHNEKANNGGKKRFTSQDAKNRAAENERRRKLYGSSG